MGWFYNPPPQPPQLAHLPAGVASYANAPPNQIGADQLLDDIRSTWPTEQWGAQQAGISASWNAVVQTTQLPPQRTTVQLYAGILSAWPVEQWGAQSIKGAGGAISATPLISFSPSVPPSSFATIRMTWPEPSWPAQTAGITATQFSAPPTLFIPASTISQLVQIRASWPQEYWPPQSEPGVAAGLAQAQQPPIYVPFSPDDLNTAIRSTWPEPYWPAQFKFGQAAWIPLPLTAIASPVPHIEIRSWAPEQWPAQAGPRFAAGFARAPIQIPPPPTTILATIRYAWPAEAWAAQSAVLGAGMISQFFPIPFDIKMRPRAVMLWPQPDWPAQRGPNATFAFPVFVPPVPYFPEYGSPVGMWPQPYWSAQTAPPFASASSGPLPPLPGFRVRCITSGIYGGVYYQPGDVFDLVFATDYSDSTVNYAGIGAGTQQFGWMLRVPSTTPLYSSEESAGWIYPIIDPVPPKRFVY